MTTPAANASARPLTEDDVILLGTRLAPVVRDLIVEALKTPAARISDLEARIATLHDRVIFLEAITALQKERRTPRENAGVVEKRAFQMRSRVRVAR